jgi:Na+/H+ antiporter NhaD/arsenite permease-like protein
VGVLRLSGFFERLIGMALRRIATPKGLLAVTIGLSGVLSAFLINDVVCVALTPLVLRLARRLKFERRTKTRSPPKETTARGDRAAALMPGCNSRR